MCARSAVCQLDIEVSQLQASLALFRRGWLSASSAPSLHTSTNVTYRQPLSFGRQDRLTAVSLKRAPGQQ